MFWADPSNRRRVNGLVLAFIFWAINCSLLHAEKLPVKTYTTADGLGRNQINRIVQDSHGFLWFCTAEGLSRFDGYKSIYRLAWKDFNANRLPGLTVGES